MLRQIMDEFYNSDGALAVGELSKRLGVEPSAIEGMLDTLVRLGKLTVLSNGGACGCGGCRGCSGCCSHDGGKVYTSAEV
jgi:hypothetical protein